MKTLTRTCVLLCALTRLPLPAQTAAIPPPAPLARTMEAGLKFRGDLVAGVVAGRETPAAALARLRNQKAPGGLDHIDPAADLGLAAIDIAHRFLAAGRPEAAEKFFREAEKSLDEVVKKTPDQSAREKALFLRKLSFIRGRYLNQAAQAMADLEQAIVLQPGDQGLQRAKEELAAESAGSFQGKPKG